jgi:hypothetical protein
MYLDDSLGSIHKEFVSIQIVFKAQCVYVRTECHLT